jgi:hypothetical protein
MREQIRILTVEEDDGALIQLAAHESCRKEGMA